MIKQRNANYCNLKLLLIFLVVYGHFIELEVAHSSLLAIQYKVIYFFHMPFFVFLSGLFLNSAEGCLTQLKKVFPIYIAYHILTMCLGLAKVETPWWILWYLLSYCFWLIGGYIWFCLKNENIKYFILILSFIGGALAGHVPALNRVWSGSRTVVFLPYFLVGLMCNSKMYWRKYRLIGIIALGVAATLIAFWGDLIPIEFLYHANGFGTVEHGAVLRILCYVIGFLLSFFLLTNVPQKRFLFTKAGVDTMPIYLFHGPVILFLREIKCPWIFYAGWTIILIYVIYKVQQWNKMFYIFCDVPREDNSNRCSKRKGAD